MKTANLPPLILDIDPFLRRSGLPYWAFAQIRSLKVGESFLLADFDAPGFCGLPGHAGVSLTRERGYYRLEAGWTAHLGKNAQRRGHLWSWLDFKLRPGRKIELILRTSGQPDNVKDTRAVAFRLVQVVLRRANLLARWAKAEGAREAYKALSPNFFRNRHDTETGAMPWLEKLRGPALQVR